MINSVLVILFLVLISCTSTIKPTGEYDEPYAKYAKYKMGLAYYHGNGIEQDYHQAALYLKQASDLGHIEAKHALATLYMGGLGVEKDIDKGLCLLKSAAKSGDISSQFTLGVWYAEGTFVDHSNVEAMMLFKMASDQGFKPASILLGILQESDVTDKHAYRKFPTFGYTE